MPPKSTKVNKNAFTTIQTFPTAFAELCGHLKKGPATANGLIKAYKGLDRLRQVLRKHRTKSTTLEVKFIEELVPILEAAVCRRVDSLIFSTIIEIILQTDYCTRCERALYLLSVSLHECTEQETKKKKKIEIGLHCLNLLLARFVDDSNVPNLRRWIGVLCTQLLRGEPENCIIIGLCPEDIRRKIGQLVTGKGEEIIRYVCGGLIRELQNENVLLDELWPIGSPNELYENFPETTQLKTGWSQKFDAYLDLVVDPLESYPERLYSAYECRLEPDNQFSAREHTMHIFCYINQITIKPSCLDNAVDQMLDIPTCCISKMTVTSDGSPGLEEVWVIFEITHDEMNPCFLNGDRVVLGRVKIRGTLEMAKGMRDDFADVCDIDDQEMLSTQSISQRSTRKLANSQNSSQLESSTGMYGTGPRLECFSSEIVLTGEGNESAPEEIAYPSKENTYTDSGIDNVPKFGVPGLEARDAVQESGAETQNGEASLILDKSPQANEQPREEQLLEDSRSVIGNNEPNQSSENLKGPGDEEDLYDASPLMKQSASAPTTLVNATPAKAPLLPPKLSKSQKSSTKKQTIKSKAKAPIRTSASTREKKLIVKEKNASIDTRSLHNSLVSLEIDSLTSPDEHNMSTPKPRDVSAITQVDKQPSLMQRMAQKGKVPKKTRSTLKNSTSKAQTLEVPDLEAKIGPGDIYEVPPDDVVHVLANPKASAVKSKAKKPIVYSSKATTNKSSISKTIGQPKKILPGHASKMNTVKTKPPGKKGLKKPQVDKATDSKIEAQESTPTQDPKATKSVKAAAQKYPIKKSYAAKSSSTTTTQGQTQQEENFSGLNDQSNQESNDDIALEEILPRRELPPSDDNKSNKVTGTKSIETKSSRNMKHVINRETEKSGKGFATGLSGFLSGFDNIDGNLGPADPSNIQYNLSATADLLMQVEDPPTRASVNHASHDLQAAEHDAAVVETVASDRPIELVLSSGFSDSSSKRKSNVDEIHPQKRKRAETPRLSPPRRSPRLQSKHHETAGRAESRRVIQDELQNDSAVQLEVQPMSAKSAIVSAPIRRTPAGKARDIEQPNLVLRDDREHRKVNMIHFSKEGPMNQGKLNGTPRPIEGAPVTTSQSQQQRQKRKFQVGQGAEVKSPPRKKRFSTPIEPPEGAIPLETRQQDIEVQSGAEVQNVHLEPPIQPKVDSTIGQAIIGKELVDNHVTINRSSPSPIEAMRFEAIKGGRPNRKSSSQGSRVAANGSPLPILSVQRMNHTKKVKENLKQTSMDMATEGVEERVKDGANIFGPRVRLESQTKSKPSPPRKFEPRYVAHRKTKSGNYQGMTTREVIGPESNLPDPFVDPTRKPSGFANRLRTSSGIQSEIDDTAKRNKAANVQTATKTNRKSRSSNVFVNDAERTLVGEQSYEIQSKASLPSMSSGNSSSNSEARSPLRDVPNGMWNVALRPHYRSLKDAVHRVADEMLIRLSDKEEAIGLVVDQYENNASRLVNSMLMLRTEDKSSMARGLLQRRSVMVQAYSEAVRSVTQSTATIRESPVAIFEKDWKTAQSQIKEKIKEGRGT